MRSFIVMGMFVASFANADWNGYVEVRELTLDAGGISELDIEAGAGSLSVEGVDGAASIKVMAEIGVNTSDEDRAREFIEKKLVLELDQRGDVAKLVSEFKDGMWGGADGWVKLVIEVPTGLALKVDDGSGSMTIRGTQADVRVDDGSGSMKISGVANVKIDDGSGSIEITDASGDVGIIDGSGSIKVRHVGGSVSIDDGSGSISVEDVEHDLVIEEDGSGGLSVSNVRGSVENDTW